jgi:uncharacterized protein YraI
MQTVRYLLVILFLSAQAAQATTGWGCFKVINVPSGDVLSLRSGPSTRDAVVGQIVPGQHGIIAESGACLPANKPPSAQWCPVRLYDGDRVAEGWVRLRYLAPSECP